MAYRVVCHSTVAPEHGKRKAGDSLTVKHNFDRGSDSDFCDPGGWNRASYESHPIDSIEPIDLAPNGYRQAALHHLQLMYSVDEFISAAPDARAAVVAIAVVLKWPSVRGLTVPAIADAFISAPAEAIVQGKASSTLKTWGLMDALSGGARAHLLNELNAKSGPNALLNELTANDIW